MAKVTEMEDLQKKRSLGERQPDVSNSSAASIILTQSFCLRTSVDSSIQLIADEETNQLIGHPTEMSPMRFSGFEKLFITHLAGCSQKRLIQLVFNGFSIFIITDCVWCIYCTYVDLSSTHLRSCFFHTTKTWISKCSELGTFSFGFNYLQMFLISIFNGQTPTIN